MRFSFVAALAVIASAAPALSLPLSDLGIMARALKYREPVDMDSVMARATSGSNIPVWNPRKGRIGIPLNAPGRVSARSPYVLVNGEQPTSACDVPGVHCLRDEPVARRMRPQRRVLDDFYASVAAREPFVVLNGQSEIPACSEGHVSCF